MTDTRPPDRPLSNRLPQARSSPVTVFGTASPLGALISRQQFFKGLDHQQAELLADSAMPARFEAGQGIFVEGKPADRFYLLLEGSVLLECAPASGRSTAVQTLGPGDDLGWSWLFPPYRLHFSAHALEPARAIFFHAARLRELCGQDHALGCELMRRIAGAMIRNLQSIQRKLVERALDAGRLN